MVLGFRVAELEVLDLFKSSGFRALELPGSSVAV